LDALNLKKSGNERAAQTAILGHRDTALSCVATAALLGSTSEHLKDWRNAEVGYRRALELDAKAHFLSLEVAWAISDALTIALASQGKTAEAVQNARQALVLARRIEHFEHIAAAHYNLAAALTANGDLDAAIGSLQSAIARDPLMKQDAMTDDSFAKLRGRPDFQKLTGQSPPKQRTISP